MDKRFCTSKIKICMNTINPEKKVVYRMKTDELFLDTKSKKKKKKVIDQH